MELGAYKHYERHERLDIDKTQNRTQENVKKRREKPVLGVQGDKTMAPKNIEL